MHKTAALIPAAGSGERLGLGPKAFLPLGQASILKHVLLAFTGEVDEIWVAVSENMMPFVEEHIIPGVQVILGGSTRQETVNKLARASNVEHVLIHDAARPFILKDLIRQCLQGVEKSKAISVVRPVADSLIDKQSSKVVDRSNLLAVQTPQGFDKQLLLDAHENALLNGQEATDDAALVRQFGHEVALIEGSVWLMKITTPADYEVAQALAHKWQLKAAQ